VRIQKAFALTSGIKMKTPTTEAIAIMSVIKNHSIEPEKDD